MLTCIIITKRKDTCIATTMSFLFRLLLIICNLSIREAVYHGTTNHFIHERYKALRIDNAAFLCSKVISLELEEIRVSLEMMS